MRIPDVLQTLRPLIAGVYLPAFLMFFGVGMLTPTLPLFAAELGVNYTLVTLAVAVTGLGTLLWNVPAGLLQARWSEHRAAIVGVLAIAAATMAMGFTRDYTLVVVFRALAGIGMATWTISRMSHLVAAVPQHHRGRAMSLFGGIMRISLFPSPAVGGALAELVSYEACFLVAGLITVVGVLPMLLMRQRVERPLGSVPARHVAPASLWAVLRDHWRDLATAGTGHVLASAARAGRQVIIPIYGAFVLGLDAAEIGVVVSASSAIDMTLFPIAGYVMDRFGRKFTNAPSMVMLGASMAVLPLAQDFVGLIVVGLFAGVANGWGSGAMLTLGSDLAPRESPGPFLGVWQFMGNTGMTGGPLIVGVVADAAGPDATPFYLAAAGFASGLIFLLLVRETHRVRGQPATASA
ncbi:MAG: MFS transporter [Chloroflexi bacterium]|nr:MFS transporter [Chloroflexota bacterium]